MGLLAGARSNYYTFLALKTLKIQEKRLKKVLKSV
jgi:hypothetical protein